MSGVGGRLSVHKKLTLRLRRIGTNRRGIEAKVGRCPLSITHQGYKWIDYTYLKGLRGSIEGRYILDVSYITEIG
jgi:hypothetical protein